MNKPDTALAAVRALGERNEESARMALIILREKSFGPLVEALEAELDATRHPSSCKLCKNTPECQEWSDLRIKAGRLRNQVLDTIQREATEAQT